MLTLILSVTPLSATPENLSQNISSYTANIKIGKTLEITRLEGPAYKEITRLKEPIFRNVICNFSITQTSSTPPSVILAGKVVSNNSGGAQEFVPVFFGSTLHHPRLAALTSIDGEFRFRVWLPDKPNDKRIEEHNLKFIPTPGCQSGKWELRGFRR